MSITWEHYQEVFIFASTEDRDACIDYLFPKRTCLETPGYFAVPGGTLSVWCEEVRFYPKHVYYGDATAHGMRWFSAYKHQSELIFGIDFADILSEAIDFWLEDLP